MRRAAVLLLAACTAPEEVVSAPAGVPADLSAAEKAAMEAALARARPQADARLSTEGVVSLNGEAYDLADPVRGADLGQALVALATVKQAGDRTLRVDVEKGTPSVAMRRLMAVFGAVGLEDYRLDLGR